MKKKSSNELELVDELVEFLICGKGKFSIQLDTEDDNSDFSSNLILDFEVL